ncbi:hypothetical protein D1872_269220 [compost metagenome]
MLAGVDRALEELALAREVADLQLAKRRLDAQRHMQLLLRGNRHAVHTDDRFPGLDAELLRRTARQHDQHFQPALRMHEQRTALLFLQAAEPHQRLVQPKSRQRGHQRQRCPPVRQQGQRDDDQAVDQQTA